MERAWVACPSHLFSPFVPFAPVPFAPWFGVQPGRRRPPLPRSSKDLSVSAWPFRLLPIEVDGNLFMVQNFGRAWRRTLLGGGCPSESVCLLVGIPRNSVLYLLRSGYAVI